LSDIIPGWDTNLAVIAANAKEDVPSKNKRTEPTEHYPMCIAMKKRSVELGMDEMPCSCGNFSKPAVIAAKPEEEK
jgi:hypothetical protein